MLFQIGGVFGLIPFKRHIIFVYTFVNTVTKTIFLALLLKTVGILQVGTLWGCLKNKWKRPEFEKLLRSLKSGDTLVVLDIDRAFRSTIDALAHIEKLKKRGVNFQILSCGWRIRSHAASGV
ncbi:MAG: recombinase family protein [Proteobacteria bacterium]|nr:recombinase family protein [Pseudomonadota bacterium]